MTRGPFNSYRQSVILVAILLFSIAAPIHITQHTVLDTPGERHFTANNTTNDSTVQTLISNLNMDDPAEVTGVVDHLNRVHVVWVEDVYSGSLNYALFDLAGYPLISTTEIPANSSLTITNPVMVVDSQAKAHIVWESIGTEIRYEGGVGVWHR